MRFSFSRLPMSRLCAVVLFFGVFHPRSVSSPSLPPAPLLRLAPSYPPLKVTFSDASPSVSKSCDSFLSVTVVDPPNPSILEIASSLASLSGGYFEVSLPARASFPFTSLSKPLSPVEEVVSLRSAGMFSPSASVRCLTAVCSPWSLVCFQICSILCDSGGSSLRVVTIGVHDFSFGCAASPATAALSLDHFRIGYLTYVSCRLYSIMDLSSFPRFALVLSITAICRCFVVLISAFGAVSLVSLSWWQVESKSSDKSSPVNLGLLGICCPFISFMEQRRFPKFPLLSGLDVQASPELLLSRNRKSQPAPSIQPPCPNTHECFVDAAWASDGCSGMGWLFRNGSKEILSQNSANHKFVGSALIAETLAVKFAMFDAQSAGFHKLKVFSDCKVLISLLNTGNSNVDLRSLLHDIRDLSVSFTSISFQFIPRLENVLADSLAKSALSSVIRSSSNGG
ncbi:Ribonuclease H-like superfamily [Arabidopsis thaliana x Arabidopsis arenosa]|uniref:Ribonuclease H-like superfamily n=1 Tax=Arabidopsis thaliana x Arabidopsis arenosa TaxID=1240361 RepID=A0A8T2AWA2_9BRAS|nr:Ribonuclease H-like superfamily [Arabidopsis thaliana x Arabidopsis arenosa]